MSEKKREIVCHLIKADVPTQNGRIYSQHALEKMAYESNKASKRGTNFVVKDCPPDGRVLLANVVGKVHETTVRDGQLVCQVEMLDTPVGKEIKRAMLWETASIEPVAYGTVKDGRVVEEDLKIVGFSFVYNKPEK